MEAGSRAHFNTSGAGFSILNPIGTILSLLMYRLRYALINASDRPLCLCVCVCARTHTHFCARYDRRDACIHEIHAIHARARASPTPTYIDTHMYRTKKTTTTRVVRDCVSPPPIRECTGCTVLAMHSYMSERERAGVRRAKTQSRPRRAKTLI